MKFVSILIRFPAPSWESKSVPDPVTALDPWTTATVPVSRLDDDGICSVYPTLFVNESQRFFAERSVSTRMLYCRCVELGPATSGRTISYGWPSESTSGGSMICTRMLAALGWAFT